ncbi:MAG: LysR family transcriptional regulator [Pseudomonadota bacterium]
MAISPPRPKGPPLNALRAFEAAARRGSFSAAADELCVTPGAVAQHVKSLEAWAGAPLFQRHAQGVEPTDLARTVLPGFVAAFDGLGEAVQQLRSHATPYQVRIAALPSIGQLWLSPQLPAIRRAAKSVSISITALEAPPNLKREQFDLSIFLEDQPAHAEVIEICRDVIFPVCAPEIAGRLETPLDLAAVTCLHDAAWSRDWPRWMAAAQPGAQVDTRGPVFSLYSLAVEEARNGAGVLIGHESLVRAHLESGALVAPFRTRVTLERKLVIGLARPLEEGSPLAGIVKALGA